MMQVRRVFVVGCFVVTFAGCGSVDEAATVAVDATDAATADSTSQTAPSTEPSDPAADFVFDAATDITLFPRTNYDVAPCEVRNVATNELDPLTEYDVSEIADVETLVDTIDLIALVTVNGSFEPLTFTPVDLPDTYREQTGVMDGSDIQWNATPVEATVDEVLSGEPVSTGNFLEIGCFGPEALPSTVGGQRLLVFATTVDPDLGPETGLSIGFRVTEWMSISDQGVLEQRTGLFGSPPSAPFLIGQQIDAVITELRAAAK